MKYNVRKYSLGPIQTNCYIVSNEEKKCLIFDPGEEGVRLIKEIKKAGLTPVAVFLTHAHFDHIGAVDAVCEEFSIPHYIHEKEVDWLADPLKNGSGKYFELPNYIVKAPKSEHIIKVEQTFDIAGIKFNAVFTPGHSPGSVTYIFEDGGFAIVGDTLFENSIGRTDLIGGSMQVLLKSIHEKILTLPEDTIIYPGHGNYTTIEREMTTNPFLNGF